MKQFLMLLRGKGALDYSAEELEKRIAEYRKWVDEIGDHYVADNRLEREGKHITAEGEVLTDGPFLEAKEIIAGYVILRAKNLDQATEIAASTPLLKYFEVYVRPIVS